jgi:transposase
VHVFADSGYAGNQLNRRLEKMGRWTVEIIKRSDSAKGFEVLPRRRVVERTLALPDDQFPFFLDWHLAEGM